MTVKIKKEYLFDRDEETKKCIRSYYVTFIGSNEDEIWKLHNKLNERLEESEEFDIGFACCPDRWKEKGIYEIGDNIFLDESESITEQKKEIEEIIREFKKELKTKQKVNS